MMMQLIINITRIESNRNDKWLKINQYLTINTIGINFFQNEFKLWWWWWWRQNFLYAIIIIIRYDKNCCFDDDKKKTEFNCLCGDDDDDDKDDVPQFKYRWCCTQFSKILYIESVALESSIYDRILFEMTMHIFFIIKPKKGMTILFYFLLDCRWWKCIGKKNWRHIRCKQ